jgi:hypothetical protein
MGYAAPAGLTRRRGVLSLSGLGAFAECICQTGRPGRAGALEEPPKRRPP